MSKETIDPDKLQAWEKLIVTIITAVIGFLSGIGAHAATSVIQHIM